MVHANIHVQTWCFSHLLPLSVVPTTQPTWWRTWRACTGQPDSRAKASASSSLTTRSRMSPSWSTWTTFFHLARSEYWKTRALHSKPLSDVFRAHVKILQARLKVTMHVPLQLKNLDVEKTVYYLPLTNYRVRSGW